jgi:hypothetical protein
MHARKVKRIKSRLNEIKGRKVMSNDPFEKYNNWDKIIN